MYSQLSRMFQLFAQLAHIHHLAKTHIVRPVQQRECCPSLPEMLPDKLQHQQLVKIRIQQRSRNRIELPVVVVRAPCQVDNHVPAIL